MTRLKHFFIKQSQPILLILSFLAWYICFREFISGKLFLTFDALPYYNQIKFYIQNLNQGIYPLWDPNWNHGTPVSFFMRRIGEFNPFYIILSLFTKMGFPFNKSYILFMTLYHFCGTLGFYVLLRTLIKRKLVCYIGFLLFLFSSLGTRMFDSYLQLIYVPLIWFFAFSCLFYKKQNTKSLLGIIFSVMILMTTYIPFYFLIIFLLFVICSTLYFPLKSLNFLKKIFAFIKLHKLFTVLCLVLLVGSALPGYTFYKQAKNNIVMPVRSNTENSSKDSHINPLNVSEKNIKILGVSEEIFLSFEFLKNIKKMQFRSFYIPIGGIILLFICFISPINKLTLCLSSWLISIWLINTPNAFLHNILYAYIPIFKLFRNLHFFLWFAIGPIFLFILSFQINKLCEAITISSNKKKYFLCVIPVHILIYLCLEYYGQLHFITIISIILSALLISFILYYPKLLENKLLPFLLLFIFILEPLNAYYYLYRNNHKTYELHDSSIKQHFSFKGSPQYKFNFDKPSQKIIPELSKDKTSFYIGSISYNQFVQTFPNLYTQKKFLHHKFIAFDNIVSFTNKKDMEDSLRKNLNIAYISEASLPLLPNTNNKPNVAKRITEESNLIKILAFNSNYIKFSTHFGKPTFLVYTDSFHHKWKAYINGKPVPIYKSNIVAKGLILNKTDAIVEFRFGNIYDYVIGYAYTFIYFLTFCFLIFLNIRPIRNNNPYDLV